MKTDETLFLFPRTISDVVDLARALTPGSFLRFLRAWLGGLRGELEGRRRFIIGGEVVGKYPGGTYIPNLQYTYCTGRGKERKGKTIIQSFLWRCLYCTYLWVLVIDIICIIN